MTLTLLATGHARTYRTATGTVLRVITVREAPERKPPRRVERREDWTPDPAA